MDKVPSVFLRKDIHIQDCENMIRWIGNRDVSQYLNESRHLGMEISELLQVSSEDMLAYHLNQSGPFYLVCESDNSSIGYVKLSPLTETSFEVVYVIGEENLWGRGLGEETLARTLRIAFLEKRADSVVARIDAKNTRSLRTAAHCGMKHIGNYHLMEVYRITADEYLSLLKH
jgi:regulator of nucleoside diphosphate kinase